MGKVGPISDQEHDEIVRMRQDGVSVVDISKLSERSTHSIYRLLKKAKPVVTTTKKKTTSSTSHPTQEASDAVSSPLLCAVESVEVSAYAPIPMPATMTESQHNATIQASAGCTTAPTTTSVGEGFWLLQDAPAVVTPTTDVAVQKTLGQFQPSKKQKTSTSQASCNNTQEPEAMESPPVLQGVTESAGTTTQEQSELLRDQPSKQNQTPRSRGSNQMTIRQAASTLMASELAITQTTRSTTADSSSFRELLQRIQNEIRRLEGSAQCDIYDAQLMQMLVKFHAEVLLVQIQKAHCNVASRTQLAEEGSGEERTKGLLREKLVKEVALLDIQAERERLELEREQMKHKVTSMLLRKRLLNANASPAAVDELLPRQ